MASWIGLLKKESRAIRTGTIVLCLITLLYFVGLFVVAWRYSPEVGLLL